MSLAQSIKLNAEAIRERRAYIETAAGRRTLARWLNGYSDPVVIDTEGEAWVLKSWDDIKRD